MNTATEVRGGLTEEEHEIMMLLMRAWSKFLHLPSNRLDHQEQFRDAIHQMQQILGMRVLERDYPDFWRT